MQAIMACDHGAVICKLPSMCSIDIKVQNADCGILDIEVEKEKERRGEEGQRDQTCRCETFISSCRCGIGRPVLRLLGAKSAISLICPNIMRVCSEKVEKQRMLESEKKRYEHARLQGHASMCLYARLHGHDMQACACLMRLQHTHSSC